MRCWPIRRGPPACAGRAPARRRLPGWRGVPASARGWPAAPPLASGPSAPPLIPAADAPDSAAYEEERFGPIAFVVAVDDAADGIARAAGLAKRKGALTAALYDTDEARIATAADAFAAAGVNLSVNLTGNIFVNQSAAFSDYHVTGANPAGNASLTDAAFIAGRFRLAMWRRPQAA